MQAFTRPSTDWKTTQSAPTYGWTGDTTRYLVANLLIRLLMTDVVLGVGKVQAVQGLVLDGRTSGRNEHILGAGFTDGLRMKPPSRAYINDNGGGGTTNHGIIDQKNVLSLQRDLRDQARSQHIRGWGCA